MKLHSAMLFALHCMLPAFQFRGNLGRGASRFWGKHQVARRRVPALLTLPPAGESWKLGCSGFWRSGEGPMRSPRERSAKKWEGSVRMSWKGSSMPHCHRSADLRPDTGLQPFHYLLKIKQIRKKGDWMV